MLQAVIAVLDGCDSGRFSAGKQSFGTQRVSNRVGPNAVEKSNISPHAGNRTPVPQATCSQPLLRFTNHEGDNCDVCRNSGERTTRPKPATRFQAQKAHPRKSQTRKSHAVRSSSFRFCSCVKLFHWQVVLNVKLLYTRIRNYAVSVQ